MSPPVFKAFFLFFRCPEPHFFFLMFFVLLFSNILFITHGNRFYVGDVPIDARYRSAFYVKWNWPRIRQTCVFMNLAMLFGFLCAGIGLIIQMPKGSDCNPVQEWWQGTTTYYIFVPSFQDTDGNGFGDLSGVIKRLDYLEGLGVKSIRLSPIYPSESFVDDFVLPNNYTDVAPILGDARDLHLLSALLHEREMFLILDMPLTQPGGGVGQGNKAGVDLELELPSILSFWMKYGVDGFAFTDLHKLGDLNDLVPGIHAWRNVLDAQTLGLHRSSSSSSSSSSSNSTKTNFNMLYKSYEKLPNRYVMVPRMGNDGSIEAYEEIGA
ncbi:Alpha-glucosidase [Armadillidium vulgare]|nr:Alpha-glucosidase [Armadillidium vulgare]